MTQKRQLDCFEEQPMKRARRPLAHFPLNLFRIGSSITMRDNTATNSAAMPTMARQERCESCHSSLIDSDSPSAKCSFCDKYACEECTLQCSGPCQKLYCGLCIVRTYADEINNSGKCFSCH